MQEAFSEPFDLVQGPLYRVNVLRRDADDHLLALTIHHAIADGWSLGAFVQDLCAAHLLRQAGNRGLPLQLSYSAWGAAERDFWKSGQIDQHIPFWRSELAEAQRLLTTPLTCTQWPCRCTDWFPTCRLISGGRHGTWLGAMESRSSLPCWRFSGLRCHAGRMRRISWSELRLPIEASSRSARRWAIVPAWSHFEVQIEHDRPFSDSLRALHQRSVDCFAHAIPFAELTRALGDRPHPGHTPIFDVRFALQNHPVPDVAVSEWLSS